MKELVEYLVTELVENKDAVVISEDGDTVSVSVDKKDMGKMGFKHKSKKTKIS